MRLRVVALVVVMATPACASPPAVPSPAVPVIMPGKPGGPASVIPPDQAGQHEQHGAPNGVDVDYVTMMIPHHRQALVMTDLVAAKSGDEQVRAIAGRIAASQDSEITVMNEWLTQYGKPVPGGEHGGHGEPDNHEDALMPGMATAVQLDALRAATGHDFDKQFLDLMIAHHQGALTMAEKQLSGGIETRAQEMAQDVITGQSAEITRMRAMRAKI